MYFLLKVYKKICHCEGDNRLWQSHEITTARLKLTRLVMTLGLLSAFNANALEIFYDSQIDAYLKQISKPLVEKSGLEGVKFHLAKSDQVNAFATNNKDIVFYSGLINKTKNKNQLEGVMAHEIAHLLAQHHVKSRVKNSSSGIPAIAGTVLGVGAVIAGAPQAGYAAIVGGSAAGVSKQLAHSREHENEADSIALKLLAKANLSKQGLADFFKILEQQERSFLHSTPEFLNSHPSTDHRKSFIQNNIIKIEKTQISEDYKAFKAKVYALTTEPLKVINKYALQDDSLAKSVAMSVAKMNAEEFSESIKYLEQAKKQGLKELWYYDILGQTMYQKADFEESLIFYKKSQDLGNNSWILDFQMAESFFAMDDNRAEKYYFNALAKFDDFSYTYKRLGDFYAKNNQMTQAHLYLTVYYSKIGDKKLTKKHLELAEAFSKQENITDEQILNKLKELLQEMKKKSKE